jgi:holo-[acyl-carrier protein] synthase
MILGIGSDLIDIRRVGRVLDRYGERFLDRVFTPHEKARALRRPDKAADTLAKRFAAKEACSKALGTGIRQGVYWRDMGVANFASGRPTLRLTGGAAARLAELVPAGYAPDIHLSLTDDHPLAQAIVVISARALAPPAIEAAEEEPHR